MPMRNAIRPATTPAADDLEGWKARVEYLENELTQALDQIESLESSPAEECIDIPFEDENDASA